MRRWFFVVLSLFILCGCVEHLNPKPHSAHNFVPWTDDARAYTLSAGDTLGLRFILNPELNERDLPIAPDGTLSAPLIGNVKAAGETVDQLRHTLANHYTPYLHAPTPDVLIHTYAAAQVYVGGEVKKQGIYAMQGPTSAMQAVIMAGGPSDTAAMSSTILIRRRTDNRPMMRTVNLRRYLNTAESEGNVSLQPGDIVFVPKTEIGSFDLFVEQYIDKAIPFNRTLNYNMGTSGMFW